MAYSDSVGANAIALVPMNLTDSKLQLLTAMIANINSEKANNLDIKDTTKVKLDDLDSRITSILASDTVTDTEIQATINAITDLQSESSTSDNFIGVLGNIFSVLNSTSRVTSYEVVVDDVNGVYAFDITGFGFSLPTDYQVQVTVKEMIPVVVGYANKTSIGFDIKVADSEEWEFNTDDIRKKDCATENVTLSVLIINEPVQKLFATFKEADGDTTSIGVPAVAPIILVSKTVANDILDFQAQQGTLDNTVIAIVSQTDASVTYSITAVSGTDAFSISSDTLKEDGSLIISKAVDGVTSSPYQIEYVSSYPQFTVADITVDDQGKTSMSEATFANYGGTVAIDANASVAVTFDANGYFILDTQLDDGIEHTVIVTVTDTDSKTSKEVSKVVTITTDGNLSEL